MGNTSTNGGLWYYFIMMGLIFLAMYFLTIRPQKKRENELKNLRNNLQLGDEVLTIGGFYGTVVRIKDDRITIASGSEKTKLEISKAGISSVLNREVAVSKSDDSAAEEKSEKVSPKKVKRLSKKEDAVDEIPAEE